MRFAQIVEGRVRFPLPFTMKTHHLYHLNKCDNKLSIPVIIFSSSFFFPFGLSSGHTVSFCELMMRRVDVMMLVFVESSVTVFWLLAE